MYIEKGRAASMLAQTGQQSDQHVRDCMLTTSMDSSNVLETLRSLEMPKAVVAGGSSLPPGLPFNRVHSIETAHAETPVSRLEARNVLVTPIRRDREERG